MSGSYILNAPKNNSFTSSFLHLNLRREPKEGYMKVGKRMGENGLQNS